MNVTSGCNLERKFVAFRLRKLVSKLLTQSSMPLTTLKFRVVIEKDVHVK